MDALLHITLLGRFEVQQGSRTITRFRTQKTASLLAYLALERTRSHSREVLIEQFWPDSDHKAARTNLSVALNALRGQLEPPGVPAGAVLISEHTSVRLNPIAFTTDVEEFENARRGAELETRAENRLASWKKAVDLYRGDLMTGFYEDWVLPERGRLLSTYIGALRNTIKECAALRQGESAIEYAQRLVQADPLREESYRILMRLLIAAGRPHEALDQYQELVRILQTVLQAVPSSATSELATQLSHLPPSPRSLLEAPTADNRPKETLPTVLPAVQGTQSAAHKIPLQFTRFFGRAKEIERLSAWMKEDRHASSAPPRLITLTGPGGTGKTRLAIEMAERVNEAFPGGLWFVPLADLDDPLRIGETLRDTLELPRHPQPAALDQVTAFLKGREQPVLLILDNFEQIAAGGGPVVWTLLNRVPLLQCLVTSRHVLALPGEQEVPVEPLPLPTEGLPTEGKEARKENSADTDPNGSPHHLLTYPSVALFVDRAQSARPEFQITQGNARAIAAICQRVEGIPLAIELAAARIKALTPAQIVERLSERFELLASRRVDKGDRHRSLWSAIDWSFHLLSPSVQRFFARLSVFHGGWTLEAAEAVCKEEATEQILSALDILMQLRGHSLLHAEESSETIRFRMLETLREFAAEQLPLEEQEEAERRHAVYFRQWVLSAQLNGPQRAVWFERFEKDFDNLRAVLAWSLKEGNDIEIGLETASAPGNFWWLRCHHAEGRQWYARLIEQAKDKPTPGLGASLHGAGVLAFMQGDFEVALRHAQRCLEIALACKNASLMGNAHGALGNIAYLQGEHEQARFHHEKALEVALTLGVPLRLASAYGNLANIARGTGDFSTAHTLHEKCLPLWREGGDKNGEARTLASLALLAHSQRKLEEARAFYEQSLAIQRAIGDRYSMILSLRGLAAVMLGQKDYRTAVACAREGFVLIRDLNIPTELLEIVQVLVEIVQALGEEKIAVRMYGALEKVREEMNYPMPPITQKEYAQITTNLQASLGSRVYKAQKQAGNGLSLEQVRDLAEETLDRHSL